MDTIKTEYERDSTPSRYWIEIEQIDIQNKDGIIQFGANKVNV